MGLQPAALVHEHPAAGPIAQPLDPIAPPRRVDTAMLIRALVEWLPQGEAPRVLPRSAGKLMPAAGPVTTRRSRSRRGAGMWAKVQILAIWDLGRCPRRTCVSMNINEDKVGEEMIPELHGGGYLLGDGEYDANSVFDAAGAAGYQLLRRGNTRIRVRAPHQSPYRLGASS